MTRWRVLIAASLILGALVLASAARWAILGECRNPAILARPSLGVGHPLPDFDAIIAVTGGLPRSNAWWDGAAFEFPHFLRLAPVSAWRMRAIEAATTEPLHERVLDDDPTYTLVLEIEVDYADGTTGVLRWARWQYGLLLCPFVVPYGDGPEWQIQHLD